MDGDKVIRGTGYLSVAAVAAVAALISYWHAVTVVGAHGEPGVYGHLYPATIDGLVAAASMVLLDAARNNEKAPKLAWWLLGAGISATLAANVLDGVSAGVLGSIIAAWPAAALVGAYEMIMVLIRGAARRKAKKLERDTERMPAPGIEAFDLPVAPTPKLDAAIRATPPWEGTERWPTQPAPAGPTPDDVQRLMDPVIREQLTADPVVPWHPEGASAGRASRLDSKVPLDLRQTGSFPAVTVTRNE